MTDAVLEEALLAASVQWPVEGTPQNPTAWLIRVAARWDRAAIAEGTRLLETVLTRGHVGSYQLQAAITAVHSEAKS